FDRLAVSDSVALAGGELDLSVVNGYLPATGDSIAILTAGTLPDTFATVLGRSTGNGLFFNVRYKPTLTPRRIDLIVGDPPPDNVPTAVGDAATLPEDGTALIDVLANDTDPDGDALVISSPGSASHGSVAIESGEIRYTPAANYFGSDAFTYQI